MEIRGTQPRRRRAFESWFTPEVSCLVFLVQLASLFFIWESALCGWGATEACVLQFAYEGKARLGPRTSAWLMFVLGMLLLAMSCLYWWFVFKKLQRYLRERRLRRRRQLLAGTDIDDESSQRVGLITPRGGDRLNQASGEMIELYEMGAATQSRAVAVVANRARLKAPGNGGNPVEVVVEEGIEPDDHGDVGVGTLDEEPAAASFPLSEEDTNQSTSSSAQSSPSVSRRRAMQLDTSTAVDKLAV